MSSNGSSQKRGAVAPAAVASVAPPPPPPPGPLTALQLLRAVDAALGAGPDLDAALGAVARLLVEHGFADGCAIGLVDEDAAPRMTFAHRDGAAGVALLEQLYAAEESGPLERAVAVLEVVGGHADDDGPGAGFGERALLRSVEPAAVRAALSSDEGRSTFDALGFKAFVALGLEAPHRGLLGVLALGAAGADAAGRMGEGEGLELGRLVAARLASAVEQARLDPESRRARHDAGVAGRALEAAHAIERAIGDSIPFGTWAADAEGALTFLSDSFLRLAGRSLDQLEGERWMQLIPAPDRALVQSQWRACVAAGAVWDRELALVGADGALRHVLSRAVPVRDVEGRVLCWAGINLDVTELKGLEHARAQALEREHRARAEAELGQRRLEFLSDASAELAASLEFEPTLERVVDVALPFLADWAALALLADNGTVVSRVLTATGLTSTDPLEIALHGPYLEGLTGLAEFRRAAAGELVTEAGVPAGLAPLEDEAREDLAQSARMLAPLQARGHALGVLVLVHRGYPYGPADAALAELLARRAALALDSAELYRDAQEATRARDEFLSVASHELRNPISGLQLLTQSCLRAARAGALEAAELEPRLQKAERQVDRLNRLVTSLLDVTRIRSGRMELDRREVDLAALVRELADRYSEEFGRADCELIVFAQEPVTGLWDRLKLDQVVTNLLTNAIKYGAGHPVEIALEATADLARLTVRDHGIGIALADQARIFERFERAAGVGFGGLGLGLWIARAIAQAHGGSIKLVSRPSEGAAFTLELPRRSR